MHQPQSDRHNKPSVSDRGSSSPPASGEPDTIRWSNLELYALSKVHERSSSPEVLDTQCRVIADFLGNELGDLLLAPDCPRTVGQVVHRLPENLEPFFNSDFPTVASVELSGFPGASFCALASHGLPPGETGLNIIFIPPNPNAFHVISDGSSAALQVKTGAIISPRGEVYYGRFAKPITVDHVFCNVHKGLSEALRSQGVSVDSPSRVDKIEMKEVLKRLKIPHPAAIIIPHDFPELADDIQTEHVIEWLSEINAAHGAVVKPVDQACGTGVELFEADQVPEVCDAIRRLQSRYGPIMLEQRVVCLELTDSNGEPLESNFRVLGTPSGFADIEVRIGLHGAPVNKARGATVVPYTLRYFPHDCDVAPKFGKHEAIFAKFDEWSKALCKELNTHFIGLDVIIDSNGKPVVVEVNFGHVGGISTLTNLRDSYADKLWAAQEVARGIGKALHPTTGTTPKNGRIIEINLTQEQQHADFPLLFQFPSSCFIPPEGPPHGIMRACEKLYHANPGRQIAIDRGNFIAGATNVIFHAFYRDVREYLDYWEHLQREGSIEPGIGDYQILYSLASLSKPAAYLFVEQTLHRHLHVRSFLYLAYTCVHDNPDVTDLVSHAVQALPELRPLTKALAYVARRLSIPGEFELPEIVTLAIQNLPPPKTFTEALNHAEHLLTAQRPWEAAHTLDQIVDADISDLLLRSQCAQMMGDDHSAFRFYERFFICEKDSPFTTPSELFETAKILGVLRATVSPWTDALNTITEHYPAVMNNTDQFNEALEAVASVRATNLRRDRFIRSAGALVGILYDAYRERKATLFPQPPPNLKELCEVDGPPLSLTAIRRAGMKSER